MPYTFHSFNDSQLLFIGIEGIVSKQDLIEINALIKEHLENGESGFSILIDATHMEASYRTVDQFRDTQTYLNSPDIDTIYSVSESKINRLITLLAFSLARARFMQFDSLDAAYEFLTARGMNLMQPDAV